MNVERFGVFDATCSIIIRSQCNTDCRPVVVIRFVMLLLRCWGAVLQSTVAEAYQQVVHHGRSGSARRPAELNAVFSFLRVASSVVRPFTSVQLYQSPVKAISGQVTKSSHTNLVSLPIRALSWSPSERL